MLPSASPCRSVAYVAICFILSAANIFHRRFRLPPQRVHRRHFAVIGMNLPVGFYHRLLSFWPVLASASSLLTPASAALATSCLPAIVLRRLCTCCAGVGHELIGRVSLAPASRVGYALGPMCRLPVLLLAQLSSSACRPADFCNATPTSATLATPSASAHATDVVAVPFCMDLHLRDPGLLRTCLVECLCSHLCRWAVPRTSSRASTLAPVCSVVERFGSHRRLALLRLPLWPGTLDLGLAGAASLPVLVELALPLEHFGSPGQLWCCRCCFCWLSTLALRRSPGVAAAWVGRALWLPVTALVLPRSSSG